jgi:hypothetical protein
VSTEPVTIDVVPPTFAGAGYGPDRHAVPALLACLGELVDARVRHCSWKSNDHLLAALAGETDLDLLVDPQDGAAFAALASRHGLKRVIPPPAAAFPAMEHYLGLDRGSGRLFHLHVYFQLVLGARFVKNHRLPVERELLDRTRKLSGIPVPPAELELGILVARALLKYRARDVVKDVLGVRAPGIPAETQGEIEWLRGGRDLESIGSGLNPIGAVVPANIVASFLDVMARDPRSGLELVRLRARLRRALRHLRRHSRVGAGATYALALWRHRRHLAVGRRGPPAMALPGGGTTVALIGADGSGKSTVAAEVVRWLGWKLDARVHYLGSKAPSPPTDGLYLGFRALRRSHRAVSRRLGDGSPAARSIAALRDLALALHHLSVGGDRRRQHARARRRAYAGGIAVLDRYPLAGLSDRPDHRLLDGPQIAAVVGPRLGWFGRALSEVEARQYRRFGLPDHLVLLDVDPLVAARRKPDHRLEVIRAKARAAAELAALAEATGVDVVRIDANRPLDRVLLDVKGRLWDAL